MPVTPYRSFPASELQVSKCQRTILGIDGMMSDTASLHVLLDSLVDRSRFPSGKIEFRYTLVSEESVVAGNQRMARWVMTTTNAVQMGSKIEVTKQGMLCCRFNSSHKIVGMELMFDVMAFMLQLKQADGTDGFSVIPNTVQTCQRTFDKPVVMTLADPPYTIVQVNKLWEEMTGYNAEQVVGKASCGILQGNKTIRKAVEDMMQEVRFKRPVSSTLINFKKSGEVFRNFLLLFPLSTDSRITHYLGITNFYDSGTTVDPPSAVSSQAQVQLQNVPATPAFAFAPNLRATPGTLPLPTVLPPVVFAGLANAAKIPVPQGGQVSFSSQNPVSSQQLMLSGQTMPPPTGGPVSVAPGPDVSRELKRSLDMAK
jgi:PAS domain S-box-containing protein